MTSGGNNFNYSPENQLTKFGALSPLNNNGKWGPKSLLNELASAIWRLIDENISDQLPKLYLFDSLNRIGGCVGRYEPLLGFCGKAPAAKRFPGYCRGLRERWMRESRCYFFCHTPKKWGVRYPHSKKWGVRVPLVSYAYDDMLPFVGL